jgi:hypothetical protein
LTFNRPLAHDLTIDDPYRLAFRQASSIHRVGPLLGLRVECGRLRIDPELDEWLLEQARRNRARLSIMQREMETTFAALRSECIESMPLKGAAMLLRADTPEELAWRPAADIDLLVTSISDRALDLSLADAGYCLRAASWKHRTYGPCRPAPPTEFADGEHPDIPFEVETHAAVVEMFRGFRWDLTPYLLSESLVAGNTRLPNDRAMGLHLAVHASMSLLEGQGRAIQLVDLARALHDVEPAWLIGVVRDAGLREHARFVYPAVALAARETGEAVCEEVAAALRWYVPERMVAWLASVSLYDASWLARDERATLDRLGIWAHSAFERARMLGHTLVPTPAELGSSQADGTGLLAVLDAYRRHYGVLISRVAR